MAPEITDTPILVTSSACFAWEQVGMHLSECKCRAMNCTRSSCCGKATREKEQHPQGNSSLLAALVGTLQVSVACAQDTRGI